MRVFGIMAVKNEVDIVAHTLRAAAEWCDAIYVLDNDSDDGTWELITQLAQKTPAIVPYAQSAEPFTDSLRARIFNAYRHEAQIGDWWCRLDADEIYVESPRAFLAKVTSHDVVWAIHLQYYFTDRDLSRFESNPQLYNASLPPTVRYRFYKADASEPRFFRHRNRLSWPSGAWPTHMGRVCPARVLVRHYKFRSPRQIESRIETRSAAIQRGGQKFSHWNRIHWESLIRESSELHYDAGDGTLIIDDSALPQHMDPFWRAAVKILMHGTGLWA
jgi:glycosyltransferase involved in cell wall biosynthesis